MMTTELNFQKKATWFEAFAYRSFLSLSDEVVGGILHGCVQLRIQLSSKLNEKSTGLFSKPLCLLSGRAFRSLHRLRSLLALLQQHLERPEKFRSKRESNPDLCDAGAVLNRLSYQADWEQIEMFSPKFFRSALNFQAFSLLLEQRWKMQSSHSFILLGISNTNPSFIIISTGYIRPT